MTVPPNRVVVVGCGDHFSSDAAAGLEVAAMLRRLPGHDCEVRDLELCSPQFISELSAGSVLIFVQGVASGSPAGTVHRFRVDRDGVASPPARITPRISDEVRNLLRLAASIPQVWLVGIELERTDAGIGISSSVHTAVLEVVRELAATNEKGQSKLPFFTETSSPD